jgi:hypothetical protein
MSTADIDALTAALKEQRRREMTAPNLMISSFLASRRFGND